MDGFTILDIIIIILFLYFILNGYKRGFIRQTSKILGLIVALLIAIKQYQAFTVHLTPFLDVPPPVLHFISFSIIFILFNLIIHILGTALKKATNLLLLGPVDQLIGALFGFVKSGVLVYVMIFILNEIPYDGVVAMIDRSYFASNLLELTPLIQQNLDKIFRYN
ncbi:MAG: CvpA family protein [Bacillota bacterium]